MQGLQIANQKVGSDERWIQALDWMVNFYDNYVGDFEIANALMKPPNLRVWDSHLLQVAQQ